MALPGCCWRTASCRSVRCFRPLGRSGRQSARALTLGATLLASAISTHALADAQHTVGPVYQLTVIETKQGNTSLVQAPGVSYAATLGSEWGFQANFTGYFPVAAYQNSVHVDVSSVYSSAWGIDAVFAAMRRFCFQAGLQLDLGVGPHFDGLVMKGNRTINGSGYSDFNSFTAGLGMNALLRWRVGHGPVSLAAFGSGAIDFLDLLHGGDLSIGYALTAGALVGIDL